MGYKLKLSCLAYGMAKLSDETQIGYWIGPIT